MDLPEEGIIVNHMYTSPGTYTVKVTVENLDVSDVPTVQQRDICIKKKVKLLKRVKCLLLKNLRF